MDFQSCLIITIWTSNLQQGLFCKQWTPCNPNSSTALTSGAGRNRFSVLIVLFHGSASTSQLAKNRSPIASMFTTHALFSMNVTKPFLPRNLREWPLTITFWPSQGSKLHAGHLVGGMAHHSSPHLKHVKSDSALIIQLLACGLRRCRGGSVHQGARTYLLAYRSRPIAHL